MKPLEPLTFSEELRHNVGILVGLALALIALWTLALEGCPCG